MDRGWILERMAKELCERGTRFDWYIADEPGEVTYYLPWWIAPEKPKGTSIVFYTHCDLSRRQTRDAVLGRADHIVCMNKGDEAELLGLGLPATRISAGVDSSFNLRKMRIGVMGRPYLSGRKREYVLPALAEEMDLSHFAFAFWGEGWRGTVGALNRKGVSAVDMKQVSFVELPGIIRNLDALLVTEEITGGPMAVIEAIASGVPVISPDVGFATDFDHECVVKYKDFPDLIGILQGMVQERTEFAGLVQDYTWRNWVLRHEELMAQVLGEIDVKG